MFENDNEYDDFNEGIDFSDLEGTPTEETETDLEDVNNDPNSDESEQVDDWSLPIKYNGEEKALSREEAQMYAQKGMNYDKVYEQFQQMQNDPRLSFVDNLARENGYDNTEEFLSEFQQIQQQNALDELIQQNIPEEYAREILESKQFREQMKQQQMQQQFEQQRQAEFQGLFDTFKELNDRDFNPEKDQIPDEVFERADKEGIPLKNAYESFMNRQLKQQLKVHQQNEQNFKRNPGGATTNHGNGKSGSSDPMLEGFDSYDW